MTGWEKTGKGKDHKLPGACSCMTLTSKNGNPYWFRTCDVEFDLRKEGSHPVQINKDRILDYEDGRKRKNKFHILGMTYQEKETWLLDGMNEEGLCGGLLMLLEARGQEVQEGGEEEVMAMEAVCYFLSCCKNVKEVTKEAKKIRITDIFYEGSKLPATVHYYFLDQNQDEVILEPGINTEPGKLQIYEKNEGIGVMTNSPPYHLQKKNLAWFLSQSIEIQDSGKDKRERFLDFDGRILSQDRTAEHLSLNGSFPGSFASYDRFIRLAVLKALNHSGRDFPDETIIPLGVGIMNTVREPLNQGIFHYSYLKPEGKEGEKMVGNKNSRTEYTIVYDIVNRRFLISWFDELNWTCYTLKQ